MPNASLNASLRHDTCAGIKGRTGATEDAFKLAFGIQIIVWTVIFAFEFLEICTFLSYFLMFYAGRARPRAYLSRR